MTESNTGPAGGGTLYDEVGGDGFFVALVDRFYARVAVDEVLRPLYPDDDLTESRRTLTGFLAQYWGGPTTYSDERGHPRLRMRHAPFVIGPAQRDAWLAAMTDAVRGAGAPPDVEARLLDYFEMAAAHMINAPRLSDTPTGKVDNGPSCHMAAGCQGGPMATIELTCMDHFIRASTDVDGAYAAVTRLGLTATNPGPAADTGAHYSVVTLGGHENRVFVEYMTHHDPVAAAADPGMADIVPLLEAGGGMRQLVFVVDDLAAARETFGAQTAGFTESVSKVADGRWEVRGLTPGDSTAAGCRFGIIQYQPEMLAAMEQAAPRTHEFPLKRVDHIAIIPADFDEGTRYWTETLGAPLHAELQGPGFLIRQMAVGDMMVELLAPTGPDSPLAAAPPGLLPVLACEVDDLAACVELARSRGFTPPDPGPGALPDTLVSTIPAGETGGIQYQLLQYV